MRSRKIHHATTCSTDDSHALSRGGASNSHDGGHAETCMNVGEAMGRAMVQLKHRGANVPRD